MTEYNLERLQGESKEDQLVRISVDKVNKLHNIDWLEIHDMFKPEYSPESLRKYAKGWAILKDMEESKISDEDIKYKEVTEILKDGSQKSDKLIKMSVEQSKDVNYLLEAHGFDKNNWELVNARNNIWNVNSSSQGVQTLYSSKITVKPKANGFDIDKFIEIIQEKVEPIYVEELPEQKEANNLLEIPLFDMHFGIADLDYYMETFNKIVHTITSKKWDKILFIVGNDLLHNDGFEGKTTSGTPIDKVNMEKAWSDADRFYSNLIVSALANSNEVNLVHVNGNHDKGITFGFAKMLEAKYPQVKAETSMKARKAFVYNEIFIGLTHGDKANSRLEKAFYEEFGNLIAVAKVKEIHHGHIHHEITKDNLGMITRSLATKAKTDDYHYENGWTGAHKRFQLFEFSENSLDAIYYV